MRNAKPLLPSPTPPAPKVSAKEAHRRIRELTEAVSRGHRVRQVTRDEPVDQGPPIHTAPVRES